MQPSSAPESKHGFWSSVRESLAGSHQDYTEGSLPRAILLLAIPMVLEMCMESLFGLVDIFWVAHLGADAVTVAGLTEGMLTILFAVALGVAIATTATVARRIGEKNPQGASDAAFHAILLAIAISVIIGAFAIAQGGWLLKMMGASPSVIAGGSRYTKVMLGGCVCIVLLFVNNAIFRGAGDAAIAMRVLWFANGINMLLDPCLIMGLGPFPRLGVTGAAVSTTIGRGCGVLYQFYMLQKGTGRVTVHRGQRIELSMLWKMLKMSANGAFQYLIATASWLGLVRLISTYGSNAVAGYTIAIRIVVFAILPSWGLSNAAATLVGQNLGAGKPERAERAVWRTGFYNMCFLGSVGVVFIVFARSIIGAITPEPAVQAIGVDCLRFVSYGYVSYAWGMVVVQAFNGAGDTRTPTLINLFCYWLWQIPLAYTLAMQFGYGPRGAFMAIGISETTLAIVAILAFRRGRWKNQKV
jgi:putative MATE family efflux protein